MNVVSFFLAAFNFMCTDCIQKLDDSLKEYIKKIVITMDDAIENASSKVKTTPHQTTPHHTIPIALHYVPSSHHTTDDITTTNIQNNNIWFAM